MRRSVTGIGRRHPSERSRRGRDRAWSRARPGSGHVFALSFLWSSLGHIVVLGAVILHLLGGRPSDPPGLEIFAAEPLAEREQPIQKEVSQADTRSAPRPVPARSRISARGPVYVAAEMRRETEPTRTPPELVADARADGTHGAPPSLSADTAVGSIAQSADEAELQQPPDAEPTPAKSSRAAAGDPATTASVVGGERDADASAVAVPATRPGASGQPVEMSPSVPPVLASKQSPGIVRALTPAEAPSPATPRIEPLAP